MKKRPRNNKYEVGLAVRLWLSVDDVVANSYEEAVVLAKKLAIADLVEIGGSITINDSYVDLIGVTDMTVLDKVGA